jgi:predicted DNA-binding protein (MmcQ/YjbR family)
MAKATNVIIQALRQRCVAKPGVVKNPYFADSEPYHVLEGFLDFFADFILDKTPPVVLLRCRDSVRRRSSRTSPGIRVSKRMRWETTGWKWTDVPIDGSIPEATLLALLDDSYQIVLDSLADDAKQRISLLTRGLQPRELLFELIATYGLLRRRNEIESLAKPALLLGTAPAVESRLALGRTKIGGRPDLPHGLDWPRHTSGKPLAFLAQINLADVPQSVASADLPRSGILYFFSVYGWQVAGAADPQLPPGDLAADWTQVLFYAGGRASLQRRATPAEVNAFKAAKVDFLPILSLPTHTSEPAVARLGWQSNVKKKYDDLVCAFNSACGYQMEYPARHLLRGFADYEQDFVDAVAEQRLTLLFQLSSDQDTEMCWGDGGYIYFWIGPRDLKRRNFKRIHTDYQCG